MDLKSTIFYQELSSLPPQIVFCKISLSQLISSDRFSFVRWQFHKLDSTKICIALTLFFPMFPFDPLENIRKSKVFWCFLGDLKGTLGIKGLTLFSIDILNSWFVTFIKTNQISVFLQQQIFSILISLLNKLKKTSIK